MVLEPTSQVPIVSRIGSPKTAALLGAPSSDTPGLTLPYYKHKSLGPPVAVIAPVKGPFQIESEPMDKVGEGHKSSLKLPVSICGWSITVMKKLTQHPPTDSRSFKHKVLWLFV